MYLALYMHLYVDEGRCGIYSYDNVDRGICMQCEFILEEEEYRSRYKVMNAEMYIYTYMYMKVYIQSYVDRWRFGNKVDDIW